MLNKSFSEYAAGAGETPLCLDMSGAQALADRRRLTIDGRLRLHFGVAVGLVEQAQAFHQEALGGAGDGGLAGGFGEVDLEAAAGPSHGLVDSFVALSRAVDGVIDLPFTEEHVALLAVVSDREQAALASHFERLQ